jgi:imidazolonepropionase-like amidohydrolase
MSVRRGRSMRKLSIQAPLYALALVAAAGWAQAADTIVIHAEEAIVRPGEVLKDVDILIIDGVIRRVEAGIEVPDGARELTGAVVCAGMIDPWSALGVFPSDLSFTSPSPTTSTADSIDPFGQAYLKAQALKAGVTSVRVQAARRAAIGGLSSVMSLAPASSEELVAFDETALAASVGLTDPSSGGSGMRFNRDGSFTLVDSTPEPMDPFERIAQIDRLSAQLGSGLAYRISQNEYKYSLAEWEEGIAEKLKELEKDFKKAKKDRDKEIAEAKEDGKEFKEEKYKEDKLPKEPSYNADKDVFARTANGELPLVVEVHRHAEIRNLLEATASYGRLRMVIAGGTEAASFAEELAARKIAVIVNPEPRGADAYDEVKGQDASLASVLHEAGVEVLIGSGGKAASATRDLSLLAAIAVGHGLDDDAALAAITSAPARVFNLKDRGAIEFGKQADLLILDGDPLSTTTTVEAVLVGGRVVVEPKE